MLYSALFLGLATSLHCIGMCGPIVLVLPLEQENQAKKIVQIILCHLGRLSTYTFIGFVFGLLGRGIYIAGFQQKLSIVAGCAMIMVFFLSERHFVKHKLFKPFFVFISQVKLGIGKQFRRGSYQSFLTIGVLNGFLPCGMVYAALFGALAMQNQVQGMLYMLVFGLGTIPLMSILAIFKTFITLSFRNKMQKVIPFIILVIGILFILRGLGIGIPYISPSTINLNIQEIPNCH